MQKTVLRRRSLGLVLVYVLSLWLGSIAPLLAQPAPSVPAASDSASVGQAVDAMINSDYKSYGAKLVIDNIRADLAAGRPIDFGKIGRELTDRSYLTNAAIGGGAELLSTGITAATAGLCPPFGLIAGSVVGATINSFGGVMGYEVGEAIKSGEQLSTKQLVGRALTNINLPDFIGRTAGSTIGAVAGQALIPIPFVGMFIGGLVGGVVGNLAVNALRNIPAFNDAFEALQKQWEKLGQSLLRGDAAPAVGAGSGVGSDNPFLEQPVQVHDQGVSKP